MVNKGAQDKELSGWDRFHHRGLPISAMNLHVLQQPGAI
jgi:hypothetical protein